MQPNILRLLVKQAAPAAPAPEAAPPPNAVNAPTTVSPTTTAGRRSYAPRVAPSSPTGQGEATTATPLTPAAPPGQMVAYNGTMMAPEEAQMQQQLEAEQQAEAQKNAPKEQAAPKTDTLLTSQLLASWDGRLSDASKLASDPGWAATDANGSQFDSTQPGGQVGGMPDMSGGTDWFDRNSTFGKIYAPVRSFLTAGIRNVQPKSWVDKALAERNPSAPGAEYRHALAGNLADPVATGNQLNPLVQLALNYGSSALKNDAISPETLQQGQAALQGA